MGITGKNPYVKATNDYPAFKPKIKVLEIVDIDSTKSRILYPLKVAEWDSEFDITTITMKQFVASREGIDGKYDMIAIPQGEYSPQAVVGKNHATQNVLNDITELKAKEIISQFIEKGQPVILESKAIKNGGNLEKYFGKYNGSDKNIIFYNGNLDLKKYLSLNVNVNVDNILNLGVDLSLNGSAKEQELISHLKNFFSKYYKPRPRFELVNQPSGDQKYKPGDNLQFKFNMTRPTDITSKDLRAFLYIDSDFNDQFDASEIVVDKPVTSLTDTISYELPRGYSGIRNWKLEVTDMGTNLKDYQKETIHFKDQKVEVNVLQVKRSSSDNSSLTSTNNMNQSYLSSDEYDINIDVTDMEEFNKSSGVYSHSSINGKYDMLIFGFADSYNNAAINMNAVSSVRKFIDTNQSILFTHDTIFQTNNNWVNSFMNDTGQKKPQTDLGLGAPNPSTTTKKVNDGLITTYPFKLDDNVGIATTHNQYYTLDLEDPNVIPWYNITGSNRDPYDSWNHYYTYSKGNITYSGTGHTNTNFPDEEQKLFVNTMYRAFLGANHAPVLTVINPKENDVIPAHQKIELSYTIQDFDLKDKKLSTKVFLNDKEVYTQADVTNGSTIVQSIDHGMPNGGSAVLKIVAEDSQGAKIEKIINLKIEKIEANLEISRTASTQDIVPVNSEIKLDYTINPKKITGEAAKKLKSNEEIISNVMYSETFPANFEVNVPSGFSKTGSLETGYTVTGNLPSVKYIRVDDEYIADPTSFEMTVIPKGKNIFTLNQSQISYTDINNQNEMVTFNPITIKADYKLEKIELPDNIVVNKDMPRNLSLDLKINPENAGIKGIRWSVTEGNDILSVDPNTGVVTAKAEGSGYVTVIVTDVFGNEKEATTYVTVRIPVTTIDVTDLTLKVGETKDLPIIITPANAINGVTINLDDSSLASINKDRFTITGLKAGVTKLKAKGINSEGEVVEDEAILTIEPNFVKSITVTPNPVNMKKFDIFSDFTVRIEPDNASNKDVIWESLSPAIVKILGNGRIEGLATGTAMVKISSTDGKASTNITVNVGSALTGISVNPSEKNIEKGKSDNVKNYLLYHPSDATNVKGNPIFTTSDNNIVEVDVNGNFRAKRLGTARIQITVFDENDKAYSAELIVHVVAPGTINEDNGTDKY